MICSFKSFVTSIYFKIEWRSLAIVSFYLLACASIAFDADLSWNTSLGVPSSDLYTVSVGIVSKAVSSLY